MAELKVRNKRVFYTTGGKAWEAGLPLLVLVHGAGCNQSVWIAQSRALAHHGWNVAALDLPGHGNSEELPDIVKVEDYSDWLADALQALGQEKSVIAGHSMGAAICLTCAGSHGGKVAALLLLGASLKTPVAPVLLDYTRDDPPQAARFITAYGHAVAAHLGGAPTPGSWMMGSVRSLINGGSGAVLHRDFAASNSWDGAPYAAGVACPTLVIAGAEDRMTAAAKGKEMADVISGAEFSEIPRSGHFMLAEAPRPVLKIMRDFLGRLPAV